MILVMQSQMPLLITCVLHVNASTENGVKGTEVLSSEMDPAEIRFI
jgi:hypothetical protein